jgi:ABC-type Mn2+/Zn2+ transport system permease subunit
MEEQMCLTIIEILFFAAGIWLIFSGKVPEKLFKVLFGKGRYIMTSTKARLFGLVLASPFPVVFTVSLLLAMVSGEGGLGYSIFLESIYVIVIALIAIVVARKIRQPETDQKAVAENKTP